MRSGGGNRSTGFTMIELLIAISIVALLASVAVPKLLVARDHARHEACLDLYQALEGALTEQLVGVVRADEGSGSADLAIDLALGSLVGTRSNPRGEAEPAFRKVEGPVVVPPPDSACTVYVFDGTQHGPDAPPEIVMTHYERGVHSFRISLD